MNLAVNKEMFNTADLEPRYPVLWTSVLSIIHIESSLIPDGVMDNIPKEKAREADSNLYVGKNFPL